MELCPAHACVTCWDKPDSGEMTSRRGLVSPCEVSQNKRIACPVPGLVDAQRA
jgi:hypothetical protein